MSAQSSNATHVPFLYNKSYSILQKKNDENFIPLSAKARYDLAKGNEAATKSKKHVTEI